MRHKISTQAATPAGTPNTIQGASVLGTCTSEAADHPVMTWVIK